MEHPCEAAQRQLETPFSIFGAPEKSLGQRNWDRCVKTKKGSGLGTRRDYTVILLIFLRRSLDGQMETMAPNVLGKPQRVT